MPRLLEGQPVAAAIDTHAREELETVLERGPAPRIATVLMSEDPAHEGFMRRKHERFEEWGIAVEAVDLDPDRPATALYAALERVGADPATDAVFVQTPMPDHVDEGTVRALIPPTKDVDCFHPENLGRLVAATPRYVPATTLAVRRLLDAYDVTVAGRDVVVVGRSTAIGRPLASVLRRRWPGGDATVTVCHSRTADLAATTRRGDVVITAAGVPELVDRRMLSPRTTVVDVSANRVETDDGVAFVGDVTADAADVVEAITPVPGGVGPVTMSALRWNVVRSTTYRTDHES